MDEIELVWVCDKVCYKKRWDKKVCDKKGVTSRNKRTKGVVGRGRLRVGSLEQFGIMIL